MRRSIAHFSSKHLTNSRNDASRASSGGRVTRRSMQSRSLASAVALARSFDDPKRGRPSRFRSDDRLTSGSSMVAYVVPTSRSLAAVEMKEMSTVGGAAARHASGPTRLPVRGQTETTAARPASSPATATFPSGWDSSPTPSSPTPPLTVLPMAPTSSSSRDPATAPNWRPEHKQRRLWPDAHHHHPRVAQCSWRFLAQSSRRLKSSRRYRDFKATPRLMRQRRRSMQVHCNLSDGPKELRNGSPTPGFASSGDASPAHRGAA